MLAAILRYKNTLVRGSEQSPAEILYGYKLNDYFPRPPHVSTTQRLSRARQRQGENGEYNVDKSNLSPWGTVWKATGPNTKKCYIHAIFRYIHVLPCFINVTTLLAASVQI